MFILLMLITAQSFDYNTVEIMAIPDILFLLTSAQSAGMAELVDALASGASLRKEVGVQVSLPALWAASGM